MVNNLNRGSEIEVSYRPNFKASERPKVNSSQEVYNLFINQWNLDKIELLEEFKIMLLNRNNRVLGIADISVGGVSGTVADSKIVFAIALKSSASYLVIAHNHPSGNLKPSEVDIRLTKKLTQAGLLLDLPIYDHLILTNYGYYSFADEGMI